MPHTQYNIFRFVYIVLFRKVFFQQIYDNIFMRAQHRTETAKVKMKPKKKNQKKTDSPKSKEHNYTLYTLSAADKMLFHRRICSQTAAPKYKFFAVR